MFCLEVQGSMPWALQINFLFQLAAKTICVSQAHYVMQFAKTAH